MVRLFEVRDETKKLIYLSDERWKHIVQRHPEVSDIEEIKLTVLNPTIIKQDIFDKSLFYCYCFNKHKNNYLMVAVKYLNGEGFILTALYTKKIRK